MINAKIIRVFSRNVFFISFLIRRWIISRLLLCSPYWLSRRNYLLFLFIRLNNNLTDRRFIVIFNSLLIFYWRVLLYIIRCYFCIFSLFISFAEKISISTLLIEFCYWGQIIYSHLNNFSLTTWVEPRHIVGLAMIIEFLKPFENLLSLLLTLLSLMSTLFRLVSIYTVLDMSPSLTVLLVDLFHDART